MSHLRLAPRASVLVAMALAVGACTGAGGTSTQSAGPTGPATTPTGAAPVVPTAPSASLLATPVSTARPIVAIAACPFSPIGYPGGAAAMTVPSDRLLNMTAKSGSTEDTLTFAFDLTGPASPSASQTLRVRESKPPFSHAGSGMSFDVHGDRHLDVVFDGMTIADPDGTAVFTGAPLDLSTFAGLRDAVQYDAFEGVLGWVVGVSDPACVTVRAGAPNEIVLAIAHN